MFDAVPFQEMWNWIANHDQPLQVDTLGRRSYIRASTPQAGVIQIQGRNGRIATIDRRYWEYVCDVIHRTAEERRAITTNYNHLEGYRFSPSVPALCRAYYEENENTSVNQVNNNNTNQ